MAPFNVTVDTVGAFFDGGFGQSDENGFRHTDVGAIDFDLDRHGIDSQQRKGFEFDKHIGDHCSKKRKIQKPEWSAAQ